MIILLSQINTTRKTGYFTRTSKGYFRVFPVVTDLPPNFSPDSWSAEKGQWKIFLPDLSPEYYHRIFHPGPEQSSDKSDGTAAHWSRWWELSNEFSTGFFTEYDTRMFHCIYSGCNVGDKSSGNVLSFLFFITMVIPPVFFN